MFQAQLSGTLGSVVESHWHLRRLHLRVLIECHSGLCVGGGGGAGYGLLLHDTGAHAAGSKFCPGSHGQQTTKHRWRSTWNIEGGGMVKRRLLKKKCYSVITWDGLWGGAPAPNSYKERKKNFYRKAHNKERQETRADIDTATKVILDLPQSIKTSHDGKFHFTSKELSRTDITRKHKKCSQDQELFEVSCFLFVYSFV